MSELDWRPDANTYTKSLEAQNRELRRENERQRQRINELERLLFLETKNDQKEEKR